MKRYIAFIVALLLVQELSAATFYEQLCEFNFNWKKYSDRAPSGKGRYFSSEKDYVQAHLSQVLPILRSNPTGHLTAEQHRSRMQLVGLLEGYCEAGRFPVNYHRYERVPVFIDEHKTHCAVAYLLKATGHEEMALRIAAADNFAWLKDIHDPELPAWQQASGLSMEELKLIQGAYDYYIPNAHLLVNKYEVPQQPECVMRYFESPGKKTAAKPENIWCYGEGKNGVLHGKWIQNYAAGMPWIVGYYENGKRSGQWEEYYQGTKQLCRTEIWRNDKLNGVRKRYDRSGILIEEILFRDGAAITKTNYDREASLMWVRKPLDSNRVYTEVYTLGGALIASGHEIVHNPGNLQWFQNIELTALNSFSLPSSTPSFSIGGFGANLNITPTFGGSSLYSTPPLVEYKKEGEWKFYKEYQLENPRLTASGTMKGWLSHNYPHFAHELMRSLMSFDDFKINASYDSILVVYSNNHVRELYGYAPADYTHLEIRYHAQNEFPDVFSVYSIWNFSQFYQPMVVKEIGQYNRNRERIGAWKHYDESGRLYKVENFILPWKEENESLVSLKAPK